MLKHLVCLVLFSVLVVFFKTELASLMHLALSAYQGLMSALASVFSAGKTGNLVRSALALLLVPLIGGLIVAVLLWIPRRTKLLSYLPEVVWALWFVVVTVVISQGAFLCSNT